MSEEVNDDTVPQAPAPVDPLSPEGIANLKNVECTIQMVSLPVDQVKQMMDIIHLLAAEVERLRAIGVEAKASAWDEGYEVRHIGHSCINPYSGKKASPRAVDDDPPE